MTKEQVGKENGSENCGYYRVQFHVRYIGLRRSLGCDKSCNYKLDGKLMIRNERWKMENQK